MLRTGDVSRLAAARGLKGRNDIPGVDDARINQTLLVVIRSLQYWPAPLAHQPLSHALNFRLRPLCLGVKQHDAADTTGKQGLFLDLHLGEGREDLALDVVRRQLTVVAERLEKKLDRLQEVGLGVQDGVLDVLPVEERHHLG